MRAASIVLASALILSPGLVLAKGVPPAGQPDISGVFMMPLGRGRSPLTGLGQEPAPLTPAAKAIRDERVASLNTPSPWADTGARCLAPGMPRVSLTPPPYPFEILQTKGKVTIVHEASGGLTRYIYLNRGHPKLDDLDPTYNGDSIGHWEGDTLVVDTVGLERDSHTIEKNGMPILGDLHITERIRRIAPDQVEDIVTLEDPKTFSKPWTQRAVWMQQPAGTEIKEFICQQNNRTVVDDKGVMKFSK
jgi:hypothetical protein